MRTHHIHGVCPELSAIVLEKPEGIAARLAEQTKTFWSFCDYMVRSVKGIERLANLACISYAAVCLLPYYSEEFQEYQGQKQEIRYQFGDKIRMNIIIHSLGQTIETVKKDR